MEGHVRRGTHQGPVARSSGRFLTPRGVVGSPACRGGRCGDIFGHELLSSVVGAPGHGSGRFCCFRQFWMTMSWRSQHGEWRQRLTRQRPYPSWARACSGSRRKAADSMFWAQMTLTRSQTKTSVSPPAMTPGIPCGPYARSWGMTSRRLPPTFMPCTPSSHPGIT